MNVIIIAAIALVVLVIMIMIFTGNIGKWRKSAESCQSQRGQCIDMSIDTNADACTGIYDNKINAICDANNDGKNDDDMICCIST